MVICNLKTKMYNVRADSNMYDEEGSLYIFFSTVQTVILMKNDIF